MNDTGRFVPPRSAAIVATTPDDGAGGPTNGAARAFGRATTSVPPRRTAAARILAGPIMPILIGLAMPTVVVLVVQALVGVVETYFISFLGTDALAGVALVFPVLMLMQMMSNGGVGGGVSSAVARASGAGRHDDAEAIVWHAVVLAVAFGLLFTVALLAGAPALYRAIGGRDGVLLAALTYSNVVFIGSVPLWLVALLSSALRGRGNVKVPAIVTLAGAAILVPLSPALIFGWGPLPRLGIAGGGVAVVLYYVAAVLALIVYMRSRRSSLRLSAARLEARLFKDILRVGGLSAIGTLQINLTVACVTAAAGLFGAEAIAGYGIASRLDYLLIPFLFGLGTAVVTMVGTNVGAGQPERARRIAWTGAAIAAVATEAVGLAAALFPRLWLGLFSDEPAVLAIGTAYLHAVAPVYGAVGLGMMLYFASQGAGRVLWPFLAGTVRMVVAALGGWLVVTALAAGPAGLFATVAAAALAFASICAIATGRIVLYRGVEAVKAGVVESEEPPSAART
jgi:putative MATE family efflux protein